MIDNELQIKFSEYIHELKKQDSDTKKIEIINSLKELIFIMDVICQKDGINFDYLKSNEILDIKNQELNEDDFLEACAVYIENAKNIIGKYLIDKI